MKIIILKIFMESKDYVSLNINKILETEIKNRLNIKKNCDIFKCFFNHDLIWLERLV